MRRTKFKDKLNLWLGEQTEIRAMTGVRRSALISDLDSATEHIDIALRLVEPDCPSRFRLIAAKSAINVVRVFLKGKEFWV